MILCVLFSSKRAAIGDLYKDIVNSMPNKNNIVLVIPSAYDVDEFSDEFYFKMKENVSTEERWRWLKVAKFWLALFKKVDRRIKNIYFHIDQFFCDILLQIFCCKSRKILWLHDPILHSGAPKKEYISRFLCKIFLFPFIDKYIISADSLLKGLNKNLVKKSSVIYLPQMYSMEFPEVKKNNMTKYDFIFFGRLEEYKGLDLLIETFNKRSDRKLLIVGRGTKESEIENKIIGKANIEFINSYLDNKELAKMISMSKCVILPYKNATGSQTIAIANYYGKIVLASKVGCFNEYIKEGENGYFIDEYSVEGLNNAIDKLDCFVNICKPEKIFNNYQRFDLNRITNKLYKEIIGG